MSEPAWLTAARADLGLKEIPGPEHEQRILQAFADAGHSWVKNDETAWCAAILASWLKRAGLKGSGELNARSYLDWGAPLDKPIPGCVVVFTRQGNPALGHVALYLTETPKFIEVLGGNQSDAVTIARYAKSRLLGYRWPKGVPLAEPDPAPQPKPKTKPKPQPKPKAPEPPRDPVASMIARAQQARRKAKGKNA